MSRGTDIADLVGTFYRGFAGEPDLLDEVVTADWEDIPLAPGQQPGPAGIKPMISGMASAVQDMQITVVDLVDGRGPDGDGPIAVRAEMSGVQVGELLGVPATHRPFAIALHEFHDVAGGRIARTHHLEDWLGFFGQVGAMPRTTEAAL